MDELEPQRTSRFTTALAIALSAYALYWVVGVINPLFYRATFLLVALVLAFLTFPARKPRSAVPQEAVPQEAVPRFGVPRFGVPRFGVPRFGVPRFAVPWLGVPWSDLVLAVLAVVALGWPVIDAAALPYRAATPNAIDLTLGTLAILVVLEATRRTVGWILPATAILFIVYAYVGPLLELIGLGIFAHRGYYPERLIGTLYMTFDGIFGTPLDVASTYIILFSIFGAILEQSGAGRFFIQWALAVMRGGTSPAAPGRAVTLAGLLMGMVSGSGVAVTVTLGSVAWPMLKRAGYPPESGGAILSAAGIGAILAPPAMGAAAFLIAEFLSIPFTDVIVMAIIPTLLYYASVFLMIERDSRRFQTHAVPEATDSFKSLTTKYWYHFLSLATVVVLLILGFTPFRAVVYATVVAVLLSYVRRESALTPRRLGAALASGARSTVGVVATTATAGIIVGTITLTGLGLRISGIVVDLAGGSTFFTVLLAAVAVWMLGLAVPVTASYIIAAVMVAPALTNVGVPVFAAHMFIFYYAVLSEVTPPTALSPFAAAAITGGNPFRTMLLAWKYTLPAFLVPLFFTLLPGGTGLLLRGSVTDVVWTTSAAMVIIAALAFLLGGWKRSTRSSAP